MSLLAGVRVVLVEPSHPGNIGGVARAMKTMGLSDLALVNPRRFPDPQAEWRAAGAQDVLDSVTVHGSLDSALADRQWIVGTSTRARRIPWPVDTAEQVIGGVLERLPSMRCAILFGRETSGLAERRTATLPLPSGDTGESRVPVAESGDGGAGRVLRIVQAIAEGGIRRRRLGSRTGERGCHGSPARAF